MPTHTGKDSKGCYAQWGGHGKKYYYTCGNDSARKTAIGKANKQGQAAHAHGYTGNRIHQYVTTNIKPIIRNDQMEGKDWIVAPTQMITEGVHNGSDGPIFYPADELAKMPAVWNYKPVVVYHPEVNGMQVSACSPDQISARKVGVLMNTKWDDGTKKLGTESWLDPARIEAVDNRVAAAIENNEMMEVSTGVYMNLERTEGEWNGESYIGIARDLQPDHLALLPDQKGACSIEDGAGFLRLNSEGNDSNIQITDGDMEAVWISKEKGIQVLMSSGDEAKIHSYLFNKNKWDKEKAKTWLAKHSNVSNINTLVMNELSHDTTRSLLMSALREDKDNAWIEDVFDSHFIYESEGKFYKQNYSVDSNQVNFDGLPKLVEKQVNYKEVAVLAANKKNNSNLKGTIMDKTKMVDALIANEKTSWTDEHRETLLAMEEDIISNMHKDMTELTKPPVENKKEEKKEEKKVDNQVQNQEPPKPKTMDEYINDAPPEIRESLRMSVNTMNAEKMRLVNVITSNESNTFTEEFLKTKSIDELKGLAAIAAPKQDPNQIPMFYGQGEPATNQENAPEPLPLPVMNFDKA